MITICESKFMVENYIQIKSLSNKEIIIQMKQYVIYIMGGQLLIDYYSSYEVRGHGHIQEVKFVSL